jgi:hypothetical protein
MNTKKKIQFIPGAVDAMREYAASQYNKLLMGYDDFQVDCEVVDGIVEQCVPQRIRCAVANDAGKATWGLHPIISSNRVTEDVLMEMIARLDALVDRADAGHEIDYYCEYNEVTEAIWFNDGDNEE